MKIEEFTRPFNHVELGFLRQGDEEDIRLIRQYTKWRMIWTWAVVVVGVVISFFIPFKMLIAAALIFIVLLALGVWSAFTLIRDTRKRLSYRKAQRKQNQVKVQRMTVAGYIYFPQVENEGDGFIFQVTDNLLIAFAGEDYNKDEKWPVKQFEIVVLKEKDEMDMCYMTLVDEAALIEPTYVIENAGSWFHAKYPGLPYPYPPVFVNGTLEDCMEIIQTKREDDQNA